MICIKCKNKFSEKESVFWDEHTTCGSIKYFKCPKCGKVTILNVIPDRCVSDPNYYRYSNRF